MLLTKSQQQRFWREWARVKADLASKGRTASQIESERHSLIFESTGHTSLTKVDPHGGFTALLRHLAIMQSDLNGVLRADQNPRRQVIWQIRRAPEAYWQKIAKNRFGTTDLDALTDDQLTQLRNTLADRKVGQHQESTCRIRNAKARARRAVKANAPNPRIQFQDLQQPTAATVVQDDSEAWWEQEAIKEDEAFERAETNHLQEVPAEIGTDTDPF